MSSHTEISQRHRGAILAVVLIANTLDLLDATLTNLAAPTIAHELGGGEALIQWLGATYALALGIFLLLGGRLGDKFGKRRLFLIGLVGFTSASLACGLAPSPALLLAARVFQGAFGALMIPQGLGILTAVFPREQLGKVFSTFGAVGGIATVGGPLLAGLLIHANLGGWTWRPLFLINLLLGIPTLLAARAWLPRDAGDRSVGVDVLSAVLLAAAMLGLLDGLIEGATRGWPRGPSLLLFGGLVCFGLFALRQCTARVPLITPTLFRKRGFTAGLILGLVFFAAVSGLLYVLTLFLQNGLGKSPMGAALSFAPAYLGIIAASLATAPLARLGRRLIAIGLAIALVGTAVLAAMIAHRGLALGVVPFSAALFVIGFGLGSCFGSIFSVTLGDAAPEEAGSASGSWSALQQLAGGAGSALVTTLFFSRVEAHGFPGALTTTLGVVGGVLALCCGLVWLLPARRAPELAPEVTPG